MGLSKEATRFGHSLVEHEEMIKHPDRWPAWPVLPLKRSRRGGTGWPEDGFLLDERLGGELKFPATLYHGNIFRLGGPDHEKYLEDLKKEEFASAGAIIAAGWGVD